MVDEPSCGERKDEPSSCNHHGGRCSAAQRRLEQCPAAAEPVAEAGDGIRKASAEVVELDLPSLAPIIVILILLARLAASCCGMSTRRLRRSGGLAIRAVIIIAAPVVASTIIIIICVGCGVA